MEFVGKKVVHIAWGEGTITSVNGNYLSIAFGVETKMFVYPDAFEKFLCTEDSELRYDVQRLITEKAESLKKAEEAAQQKSIVRIQQEPESRIKRNKSSKAKDDRQNIAIKCNYCNGGCTPKQIGYDGVCTDDIIRYNIEVEHRNWCTQPDSYCMQYYQGELSREDLDSLCEDGGWVCYESQMLREWRAMAGMYTSGEKKGEPMKLRKVQNNSLAVLTTREPGTSEDQRIIFAVFLVDECDEGNTKDEGYVTTTSKFKIKLSATESHKLRFWKYHANDKDPSVPAWASGLHRYFSDEEAAQILFDVARIKHGTPEEKLAKEFFEYFCITNKVDLTQLEKPKGALVISQT